MSKLALPSEEIGLESEHTLRGKLELFWKARPAARQSVRTTGAQLFEKTYGLVKYPMTKRMTPS